MKLGETNTETELGIITTGTPTVGQIPTATSGTEASWQDLDVEAFDMDFITLTRGDTSASGSVNYSHNLGKVPSFISFENSSGGSATSYNSSFGSYDGTTNRAVYKPYDGNSTQTSSYCIYSKFSSESGAYQRGVVTAVTDTNFTIQWTYGGTSTRAGTTAVHVTLI